MNRFIYKMHGNLAMPQHKLRIFKLFALLFLLTTVKAFAFAGSREPEANLRNHLSRIDIKGKVLDEQGKGLPGVSIRVKGKKISATTSESGNFTLNGVSTNDLIVVSYVGYVTQEILVKDDNLTVVMKGDVGNLDEVVVVGYGTTKRSDLTGSISSIKPEQISNAGTVSIDQALAGKASGVQVTQNSGVPGGGATIKIRGISSLRGSQPLYVVDGVLLDNTSMSAVNGEQEASSNISPLSTISSSDIASIEILKDASATAIYGSRGANGVILITTKLGKSGRGQIDFASSHGISVNPNRIELMDANQYWISRNTATINAGTVLVDKALANFEKAKKGLLQTTDWQDAVFKTGFTQDYNLNFSGGNQDIKYRLSNNYFDGDGIIKNTDFNRISTRLNLDAKVNGAVSIGARLYYAIINSDQVNASTNDGLGNGNNSVIRRALESTPSADIESTEIDDPDSFVGYSPTTGLKANQYKNFLSQFVGNAFIDLAITKNLSFKTDLSYQGRNTSQRYYQLNILPKGISKGGWAKTSEGLLKVLTNTNTLNYNLGFTDHKIDMVFGQSIELTDSYAVISSNYGFANDYLTFYAPQTALFNDPDTYRASSSKLISFFSRVNYTYKDKFLFTFTGRADGASKFAENKKFGFFPAFALGYKLSEEKFLKDSKSISSLKLRLSYGLSGNQAIQPYQSLDQLASSMTAFGAGGVTEALSPVFYAAQLPNNNLQWEQSAQTNVGFDLGLLNDRFSVTFDYYIKNTDKLLVVGNRIPAQSGFTSYTENLGLLATKGADLGISAQIFEKSAFKWSLSSTMSVGKTKIKEMGADYILSGYNQGWVPGGSQRLIIGDEIGAFFGYKSNGISQFDDFVEFTGLSNDQRIAKYNANPAATYTPIKDANGVGVIASRPGQQLYVDADKNGIINEFDKQVIGYAQPDFTLGISNSFSYKNFEMSINVDGQFGQQICNVANFNLRGFHGSQQLAIVKDAWTAENQSKDYPRVSMLNTGAQAFLMSDKVIEDGSFWRLQNVTLGYRFSSDFLSRIKIRSAKVYASGSNLMMITNYSGYNPDVSLNGTNSLQMGHDNAGYPVARTFRVGLDLQF